MSEEKRVKKYMDGKRKFLGHVEMHLTKNFHEKEYRRAISDVLGSLKIFCTLDERELYEKINRLLKRIANNKFPQEKEEDIKSK